MSEILYLTCCSCGKTIEADAELFEDSELHPSEVVCRECGDINNNEG